MNNRRGVTLAAAVLLIAAQLGQPADALQAAGTGGGPGPAPSYQADTGDAWIDARLKELNTYAPRYPEAFIDEISRYMDVPRGYVVALGQQPGWAPGDVYFACALGKVLAQPCRQVVRARAGDPDGDWEAIANSVAGEGNPIPNRALRELLRSSYAHWARPLD